ncbi:hypothetical protein F5Y05DRAFT_397514 [Hypoxylon sp. FL0543]|nr:hypothetical protein F5Y05DRAFT_397514 [Hypoxylon sp. FL0543]
MDLLVYLYTALSLTSLFSQSLSLIHKLNIKGARSAIDLGAKTSSGRRRITDGINHDNSSYHQCASDLACRASNWDKWLPCSSCSTGMSP